MDDKVSVEPKGDINIIKCEGQIDSNTYYTLKDTIKKLIEKKSFKIIIDLSDTTFVSSSGWGTIIGNLKDIRKGGGDIVVTGMTGGVKHVFEAAQFDELIKASDTIEDAIKFFS